MGFHRSRDILFPRGLTMPRMLPINIGILLLSALCLCQSDQQQPQYQHHPPTPVIGGLCKLDSPDVQIGGKQTQFFLRCEPTLESAPGEGVWVVKSRNAGQTASRIPAAALVNREQQQEQAPRKSAPKTTTYICDLVSDAAEHQFCSTSENCLQPVYMERDAFLQCDSITRRWVKKHCQQGFNFDFERQACIAHTTPVRPGHQFRQFPDEPFPSATSTANSENSKGKKKLNESKKHPNRGIVCTFADCSISTAPCNIGTCNNGYCCAFAVGELPTAKFPVEPLHGHPPHLMDQPTKNNAPETASNPPNSTTIPSQQHPASSPSSIPPISASIPPSILVIALNDPSPSPPPPPPPTPESLLILDDFPGASFSLQKILGTLQHQQRPFNKAEPMNELCSSGFHSPIRCDSFSSSSSIGGECPPGLACDFGPKLCCPIPLPKAKNRQKQFRRIAKWPTQIQVDRENDGPQKRRMAMRRRLARRRFSSFLGGSPINGWCSPCLPVNFLPTPNQQKQIFTPNLFSANLLSDICPGGVPPLTSCATNGGFCAPPLQCVQPGICCAMPAPPPLPPPPAYACPGGLPALGQCIAGRCLSPAAVCSSPGNVCCAQAIPAAIPATVCPDGTQAAGACVNNQCGTGFTCNQGLCCTNSSQTPRCLDGSQSIGACIQGRCGTGYTCTTGNICCPSQLNPCPPGQVSIGLAVNGRCPTGFTLFNGQCCGTQSNQQSQISCPEFDSTGPCDSNQRCPEQGFVCDTANNWCCPQVFENEDPIGPCIQGEGGTRLCPEGYACVGENEGECRRLVTGTCPPEEQLGPCGANNECPPGYECLEGFCCPIDNNTRYRQRRKKRETTERTTQSAFLRLVRGMRK